MDRIAMVCKGVHPCVCVTNACCARECRADGSIDARKSITSCYKMRSCS